MFKTTVLDLKVNFLILLGACFLFFGISAASASAASSVFYSVGQTTDDLKTGTPNISITSGLGTFDVPQTGNIGVGDVIDYDTDNKKVYITGKIDTSNWQVIMASGLKPTNVTDLTVNSIKRAYTSLSSAEAGASDANHLNTSDLVTANVILNFPCYYDTGADTTAVTIDGWTTGADNYIKVYTPNNISTECNISQRHSGKWNEGKWRLEVSNNRCIYIADNYSRIDGLQLKVASFSGTGSNSSTIYGSGISAGNEFIISNNILKAVYTDTAYGYGVYINDDDANTKTYNNIAYDFINGAASTRAFTARGAAYVYNNTAINSHIGFSRVAGTYAAKNNLAQNCDDGFDGIVSSSDYNISDISGDTTGGAHDQAGVSVKFVDENNDDFHLAGDDTVARDQAADLSVDSYFAFNSDIDGNTRPTGSSWDIGADEGATAIYRSVGPSATAALATDESHANTIAVSSGTATFSAALPDNIGVGDAVIIDTGGTDQTIDSSDTILFIKGRTDSQHYSLQTQTGATPSDISSNDTYQIFRAYTSLSNAEAGTKNTSIPISFTGGNRDLVTNNEQWNIACYANGTTADSTGVTISGWTTGPNNYLKVYTPTSSSEVGTSQRHKGRWDEGKYRLEKTYSGSTYPVLIEIGEEYTLIDGLQLKVSSSSGLITGYTISPQINNTDSDLRISNNILQIESITGGGYFNGIYGAYSASQNLKIWNNIIYDSSSQTSGTAILGNTSSSYTKNYYVYNNTVVGWHGGISGTTNLIAKNNITQNCDNGFGDGLSSFSDYNISDVVDDTTGGAHDQANTTVSFISEDNDDFHLSPTDTAALNAGANLSQDSYLNFQNDIDGDPRDMYWSIGADEGPKAIINDQLSMTNENANSNLSLNDGLVGYWSFNGPDIFGTTAYDRSGNNNNGTINGATPALGVDGQGVGFDGTNNIVVDNESNFDFDRTDSFSISAWVKYNNTGNGQYIATKTYNTGNFQGWQFQIDQANHRLKGYLKGVASGCAGGDCIQNTTSTGSLSASVWHYVVMTYDGSSTAAGLRLYIDGTDKTVVGGSTISSSPLNNKQALIGNNWADGGGYFNGSMDEVRVYNRALSQDEISKLYNQNKQTMNSSQAGQMTNGLVGHWTFDGSTISGTTAADSSGLGNNGTISGATPITGILGQGMGFDGGSDKVSFSALSPFPQNITVAAWIKVSYDQFVHGSGILDGYFSGDGFLLSLMRSGGVDGFAFMVDDVQLISSTSTTAIDDGNWHLITATYDGSQIKLYKDGLFIKEVSATSMTNPSVSLDIGVNASVYFNGSMDDVRIYNRALSADEVGDLYNAGVAEMR